MEHIWALWKTLKYLQTLNHGMMWLKWDWRAEELAQDNWDWKQRIWPRNRKILSMTLWGQKWMPLLMSQVAPLNTQSSIWNQKPKVKRTKREASSLTGSKLHNNQIYSMRPKSTIMSLNRMSKTCIEFLIRSIKMEVVRSRPMNSKNTWEPMHLLEKNFTEVNLSLMTMQSENGIKVRTHLIQKSMVLQRMKSVKQR